jgi:integrase
VGRGEPGCGWGEIYEDSTKSEASDRWLPIPAPALEALKRTKAIQAAEQLVAGPAYQAPAGGPKMREEWYLAAAHEDVDNKARWISQQLRAQGDLISEAGVHSWIGRLRTADKLPKAPYARSGLVVVDELALRPQYYSDLFEQLTKEAGLPPITLHGARHFAASLFGHLGVDIVVAAAWLGQSQTSITEQYQHAFHEALRDAGGKLGKALQSGL